MYKYEHVGYFFFNDTATTEIYTLSLHDALPIWPPLGGRRPGARHLLGEGRAAAGLRHPLGALRRHRDREPRSEEHTSELQSRQYLVCRLLLEKKKNMLHYLFRLRVPLCEYAAIY